MGNLKDLILNRVPFTITMKGGKALLTKCVFCDEGKHYDSKHLQINLAQNKDEFNWCYCYLCHTHSIITPQFLMDNWEIYDMDILSELTNYNKKLYNRLPKINKYKEINSIYYTYIRESKRSHQKLNYINERLGTQLKFSDLIRLKILVNLNDLISENSIKEYTRDPRVIDALDKFFIGFISYDNSFINMRNLVYKNKDIPLHKSVDKRFVNYNLFDKLDNTKAYYTIPTEINIASKDRIKIHITEGGFDILSVYLNLRKESSNSIYTGIIGSQFKYLVQQYIKSHGFINSEFHLYKDNDRNNDIFYYIKNMIRPYNIPLYLHYNNYKDEKDFGVPISRINEKVIEIQ